MPLLTYDPSRRANFPQDLQSLSLDSWDVTHLTGSGGGAYIFADSKTGNKYCLKLGQENAHIETEICADLMFSVALSLLNNTELAIPSFAVYSFPFELAEKLKQSTRMATTCRLSVFVENQPIDSVSMVRKQIGNQLVLFALLGNYDLSEGRNFIVNTSQGKRRIYIVDNGCSWLFKACGERKPVEDTVKTAIQILRTQYASVTDEAILLQAKCVIEIIPKLFKAFLRVYEALKFEGAEESYCMLLNRVKALYLCYGKPEDDFLKDMPDSFAAYREKVVKKQVLQTSLRKRAYIGALKSRRAYQPHLFSPSEASSTIPWIPWTSFHLQELGITHKDDRAKVEAAIPLLPHSKNYDEDFRNVAVRILRDEYTYQSQGYVTVYHAVPHTVRVLYEVQMRLAQIIYGTYAEQGLAVLRFLQSIFQGYLDLHDFYSRFGEDNYTSVSKQMLICTNLFFLTGNKDLHTSSSAFLFAENNSSGKCNVIELFHQILQALAFDAAELNQFDDQIKALIALFAPGGGSLYQIHIDGRIVDKVCIPTRVKGSRGEKCSEMLEAIAGKKLDVEALTGLQIRVFLDPLYICARDRSIIAVANSHHELSPGNMEQAEAIIERIARAIVSQVWEKGLNVPLQKPRGLMRMQDITRDCLEVNSNTNWDIHIKEMETYIGLTADSDKNLKIFYAFYPKDEILGKFFIKLIKSIPIKELPSFFICLAPHLPVDGDAKFSEQAWLDTCFQASAGIVQDNFQLKRIEIFLICFDSLQRYHFLLRNRQYIRWDGIEVFNQCLKFLSKEEQSSFLQNFQSEIERCIADKSQETPGLGVCSVASFFQKDQRFFLENIRMSSIDVLIGLKKYFDPEFLVKRLNQLTSEEQSALQDFLVYYPSTDRLRIVFFQVIRILPIEECKKFFGSLKERHLQLNEGIRPLTDEELVDIVFQERQKFCNKNYILEIFLNLFDSQACYLFLQRNRQFIDWSNVTRFVVCLNNLAETEQCYFLRDFQQEWDALIRRVRCDGIIELSLLHPKAAELFYRRYGRQLLERGISASASRIPKEHYELLLKHIEIHDSSMLDCLVSFPCEPLVLQRLSRVNQDIVIGWMEKRMDNRQGISFLMSEIYYQGNRWNGTTCPRRKLYEENKRRLQEMWNAKSDIRANILQFLSLEIISWEPADKYDRSRCDAFLQTVHRLEQSESADITPFIPTLIEQISVELSRSIYNRRGSIEIQAMHLTFVLHQLLKHLGITIVEEVPVARKPQAAYPKCTIM